MIKLRLALVVSSSKVSGESPILKSWQAAKDLPLLIHKHWVVNCAKKEIILKATALILVSVNHVLLCVKLAKMPILVILATGDL